jgi:hypothetical protein
LDSCAETGGEAAPMCAFDFLLKKSEYYVHIQNCIHILFNFSSRHFSFSVLSKAVYEMKFLWKKALLFSPKSCQNGKNSTADNLTITDPNGKVRIYSGSSWLELSYHIGVYMFSTESWNQLVTEFLNPLYSIYSIYCTTTVLGHMDTCKDCKYIIEQHVCLRRMLLDDTVSCVLLS